MDSAAPRLAARRSRCRGRRPRRRCSTPQGAIDALAHRRDQLEREIVALVPGSPWVVQVGRLRCLRGVDTLTAVGLCAEVGDFERFARAEQLMSYVGLVPCESTTGQQRRLGSITKTWSGHARRLLDRGRLALPPAPPDRQGADRSPSGQPAEVIASPGQLSSDSTAPGPGSNTAPSAARSSRSRRPANSPGCLGGLPNRVTTPDDNRYPVGCVGGGPATRGEPATVL